MFSGLFSIIASYADISVALEVFSELVKLETESFLGTENVELMEPDKGSHMGFAPSPAVAGDTVGMVGLADIVGGDIESGVFG